MWWVPSCHHQHFRLLSFHTFLKQKAHLHVVFMWRSVFFLCENMMWLSAKEAKLLQHCAWQSLACFRPSCVKFSLIKIACQWENILVLGLYFKNMKTWQPGSVYGSRRCSINHEKSVQVMTHSFRNVEIGHVPAIARKTKTSLPQSGWPVLLKPTSCV